MPPYLPRKRLRSLTPEVDSSPTPKKTKASVASLRKPTLFDAIDASAQSVRPADHSKNLLAKLAGSESDSSLSSLSSPEPDFEDVSPPSTRQRAQREVEPSEDEEDDFEFEDVSAHTQTTSAKAVPPPSGDLDLTLTKETRMSVVNPHNKKQGPTKIERGIRVATHQMHVMFLMWHNAVRNAWICDREVHEILVGQLGPGVQKEIDQWRVKSGLAPVRSQASQESGRKAKTTPRGGMGKAGGKSKKSESKRGDWSKAASAQAHREVDMSHGDPLFHLLNQLSRYWRQRFRVTEPGLRKMGYMSLQRIDEEIKSYQKEEHDPEMHGERIAALKDFRERAKLCEGSRDLGAQLFTALLRGIGLETRLVASLQPSGFGWSKTEEAIERKKKRLSTKDGDAEADDSSIEFEEVIVSAPKSATASAKKPTAISTQAAKRKGSRASGAKSAPIDLSDNEVDPDPADDDSVIDVTPARPKRGPSKLYEKDLAPNYWSEVLSPVTNTWTPCSTLLKGGAATSQEQLLFFEPKGGKAEKAKQVMAYLVAHSSDGTAKDVTVRYLRKHMWPGKTKGMRMGVEKVPIYNKHGKVKRYEEFDWFKTVMSGYQRRNNKRTEIDDHEEASDLKAVKPERKEVKEGEETLQSYKSSAEFILERHLRREEAILLDTKHVKMFAVKGRANEETTDEKVFLRKDVVKCKSIETWHKEGRAPKIGEHPLKRVPYRAATTNRKRELAEAELASGGEKMLQGLYGWDQTDWIIPPAIENGVIPKNAFGNMDVYVPSMVPEGAVHLPYRGTMRICKSLGIDFAEAVTGFEFGARMAIPVITGVVVAEENEEMVMEGFRKYEAERLRKEDEKRTKAALGMWRKFLMGLRIVERVREEYGDQVDDNVDVLNPWTNKNKSKGKHVNKEDEIDEESRKRIMDQNDEDMAGGFLPDGMDVEEPPQTFFPTTHEDDHGDGGFVVEDHADDLSTVPATSYATPVSLQSSKAGVEGDADTEKPKTKNSSTRGKPDFSKSSAKISTKPGTKRATARNKVTPPSSKKISTKGRSSRAKAPPSISEEEDEDDKYRVNDDDTSSLSELSQPWAQGESDMDADTEINRKSRPQVIIPSIRVGKSPNPSAASTPSTRTAPKRQAARKSATALKSHYFEHSDDDDDE